MDQAFDLAKVIIQYKSKNIQFDIDRCMKKDSLGNAPLSALLYCFAMIDFMGALFSGEGGEKDKNNKRVDTPGNSEKYPHDKDMGNL